MQVGDGDHLEVGNIKIDVFFTPCHTRGHVLYLAKQDGEEVTNLLSFPFFLVSIRMQALFTGDMLFVGGCGRFFEGNAQQMHHALNEVIASLPDATKV